MRRAFRILAALIALIGFGWLPAHAAVGFDACATVFTAVGSGATLTIANLTVGAGSNRALVAVIGLDNATHASVTSPTATWNGVSMGAPLVNSLNTGGGQLVIFGLANPASGNNSLVVNWTGTSEANADACAWTGVDQTGGTTSFPNGNTATAGSGTPTIAITSNASDAAMAIFSAASNFTGGTASQTEIFTNSGTSFSAYEAQRTNPNGSASVSFSVTGAGLWNAAGIDIKASGGAPSCPHTLSTLGAGC